MCDCCGIADERLFNDLLAMEQKRMLRAGTPFLLMLVAVPAAGVDTSSLKIEQLGKAIARGARETDIAGWYVYPTTFGIIFTAIGNTDPDSVQTVLTKKAALQMRHLLGPLYPLNLRIHFQLFSKKVDSQRRVIDGSYEGNGFRPSRQ